MRGAGSNRSGEHPSSISTWSTCGSASACQCLRGANSTTFKQRGAAGLWFRYWPRSQMLPGCVGESEVPTCSPPMSGRSLRGSATCSARLYHLLWRYHLAGYTLRATWLTSIKISQLWLLWATECNAFFCLSESPWRFFCLQLRHRRLNADVWNQIWAFWWSHSKWSCWGLCQARQLRELWSDGNGWKILDIMWFMWCCDLFSGTRRHYIYNIHI